MPMVLMAANASGIMQETKVGKEMILIVIKAWDMHSRVGIQNLKDVFTKYNHASQCLSIAPECDCTEGSVTLTIVAVIIYD